MSVLTSFHYPYFFLLHDCTIIIFILLEEVKGILCSLFARNPDMNFCFILSTTSTRSVERSRFISNALIWGYIFQKLYLHQKTFVGLPPFASNFIATRLLPMNLDNIQFIRCWFVLTFRAIISRPELQYPIFLLRFDAVFETRVVGNRPKWTITTKDSTTVDMWDPIHSST